MGKEPFNQFELYFILKYCSHLFQGYGVLDLNSKGDYMVYNLIKDERQVVKYPVVLTTHHGLYSILEKDEHTYADFDIVFFDVEWWYRNYNAYLSRTCDLYYIQNFVDMLMYKYNNIASSNGDTKGKQTLSDFDMFFTMFLGILWTDTKKLFLGRAEDDLIINPLANHPDFYQTNLLLPKLKAFKEPLQMTLSEQDFQTLWKQIEHFLTITETIAKVQRKMYGQTGSDFYFLFSEDAKFTNRDEFKELFHRNHIVFLSNHEKGYKKLVEAPLPPFRSLTHITTLGGLETKLSELSAAKNAIFIISTVKDESREIFEALQKMRFLADYELLVENITGGAGKNMYKANKKQKKILVGGYNFLMMCYAQKIRFDEILVWNVRGSNSEVILSDVKWYQPK
ncbi:MAG: hypothetical protein LBU27_07180 [Candidatus Peribacteria bacterium]|nr:hypothetical protein [Candidatus Peribacteria bacterium]